MFTAGILIFITLIVAPPTGNAMPHNGFAESGQIKSSGVNEIDNQPRSGLTLTAGTDFFNLQILNKKLDFVVGSIDYFHSFRTMDIPEEPGFVRLLSILEPHSFQTSLIDINGYVVIGPDGNFEIPRVFLRADGTSVESVRQLQLTFNAEAELIDAKLMPDAHDYLRILNRSIPTESARNREILQKIDNYRESVKNLGENDTLVTIAPDAYILDIALLWEGRLQYNRMTTEGYIRQLKDMMEENGSLQIKTSDIATYRHPDFPDIFGARFFQTILAGDMARENHVFMVMQEIDGELLIQSMIHQQKPFGKPDFADALPPVKSLIITQDITRNLPNFNTSYSDSGLVQIIVNTQNTEYLNSRRVLEMLRSGIITFSDVNLDLVNVNADDPFVLMVPFRSANTPYSQFTFSDISILESSVLDKTDARLALYHEKVNPIQLVILEERLNPENFPPTVNNFIGELHFFTNYSDVDVKLMYPDGRVFRDFYMLYSKSFEKLIVEGVYKYEVSRDDLRTKTGEFEIFRDRLTTVDVKLEKYKRARPVQPQRIGQNWFQRNAGVVTITGIGVIGLTAVYLLGL